MFLLNLTSYTLRRIEKAASVVVFVALAGGVIYSHQTGSLYPGLPFAAGFGVLLLAGVVLQSRAVSTSVALVAITVGLVYRIYAFEFPASMVSFDPDAYAVQALIIAQTGSTEQLILSEFYSAATAFSVFNAESILVLGLPTDSAFVTIPLLAALVIPVSAMAIAHRVTSHRQTFVLAAVLTTLGPATIKYGIRPNPIFFSGLIFSAFAVTLISYPNRRKISHLVLSIVLLFALMVSHKIAVIVVVLVCLLLLIGSHAPFGRAFGNRSVRTAYSLALIAGAALVIQWMFLTQYISRALPRILAIIGVVEPPPELSRAAAVPYEPQLAFQVLAFSFVLTTLAVGGLVWLGLLKFRYDAKIARLLAIAGGTVAIVLPGRFSDAAAGTQRTFFFATAGLGALVAVGRYFAVKSPRRYLHYLSIIAIAIILVSQPLSAASTPDYRDGARHYLTQGEVNGKAFAQQHTQSTVYMDRYYWDEVIDFERAAADGGPQYQAPAAGSYFDGILEQELTEGTLLQEEYQYVLLRTNVGTYRMDMGRWVLTWDPVASMAASSRYHQTYSNGHTMMFSRRDTTTPN